MQASIARATLHTSVPQALLFAQHNNNVFQQADCIHSFDVHLVPKTSFNLPPTVVLQQALSV
jgi:hypothetical protein